MMGSDQEFYYAARVRDVWDGYLFPSHPYYSDQKNLPYAQPPLPSWIYATLIGMTGQSFPLGLIVTKFLMSLALFGAMLGFSIVLSGRKWASVIVVSAVLCAWYLFTSPGSLASFVSTEMTQSGMLRFARLTHPQISMTGFFAALALIVLWTRTHAWKHAIAAGLATGVTFWLYPYAWSFLGITLLFLLGYFIIYHRKHIVLQMQCISVGMIALLCGLPYILHTLSIQSHPFYDVFSQRIGLVHSNAFIIPIWSILSIVISWIFGKRIAPTMPYIPLLLSLTGLVVFNQQVITGVELVPAHYHWYIVHPLAVIMLILATMSFIVRKKHRQWLAIGSLAIFVIAGLRFQLSSYQHAQAQWGMLQSAAPAFAYMNERLNQKDSVYAQGFVRELISVYTPADTVMASNASTCCLTSTTRLEAALFFDLWVRGISAQGIENFVRTEQGKRELSSELYGIYYREQFGSYDAIKESALHMHVRNYQNYLALPLQEKINKANLTHVLLSTDARRTRQLNELLADATIIYEDDAYTLWSH